MKKIVLIVSMLILLTSTQVSAMTVLQFYDRFGEAASANGVPEFNMMIHFSTDTKYDRKFTHWYSDRFAVVGYSSHGLNRVENVSVVALPRTAEEAGAFLTVVGLMMSVLNPDLTADERRQVLYELKLTPERISELETSTGYSKRGVIEYTSVMKDGVFSVTGKILVNIK